MYRILIRATTAMTAALVAITGLTAGAHDGPSVRSAEASTTAPATNALPSGDAPVLADVPVGHRFYTHIMWMHEKGLTVGIPQPDGTVTYNPSGKLNRGAMAAFLYRQAGSPKFTLPRIGFVDVPDTHLFYKPIMWMKAMGYAAGVPTGNGDAYKPGESLSRGAMAAFLYRQAGSPATPQSVRQFDDVKANHQFYKHILWMRYSGLSKGSLRGERNNYAPAASLTREGMAAFLYRQSRSAAGPTLNTASYNVLARRFDLGYNKGLIENDKWPERKKRVLPWINEQQFDVLGLQEVMGCYETATFKCPASEPEDLMYNDIKANLPAGYAISARADGLPLHKNANPIIWNTNRLERIRGGQHTIHPGGWMTIRPGDFPAGQKCIAPSKDGKQCNASTRWATWEEFKDKRNGRTFVYINTHMGMIEEPLTARLQGIDSLKRLVEQFGNKTIIFGGDFNEPLGTTPVGQRVSAMGFSDSRLVAPIAINFEKNTWLGVTKTDTSTSWRVNSIDKAQNGTPIDHIMFKGGLTPLSYNAYLVPHSDHLPIQTTFAWLN